MKSLTIKQIAIIGLFAAMLTGGKLALMGLPNIEVVTLFIVLFSFAFGLKMSLISVLVFCSIEALIFGFNTWLVAYFIHWPMLAVSTALIYKIGCRKNVFFIILGIFMTFIFGVITSLVDTAFVFGSAGVNFFTLFAAIYARGVLFYAVHIASNAVFLFIAFPLLRPIVVKAKTVYLGDYSS